MIFGLGFVILEGTSTRFYPATALGGAFWGTGVSLCLSIIRALGIGPAYLVPDVVNCIGTFVIGYFGLFGTTARPSRVPWLAFIGVSLILLG